MPIARFALSVPKDIESTFNLFDSLTVKSLLASSWSRVSEDTNLTIEIKRLLTTTSHSEEFHPSTNVKVSVYILTQNIKPSYKDGVSTQFSDDNKLQTAQRNVAVPLVHELDIPQAAQTDRIVSNLSSACLALLGCKDIRHFLRRAI